MAFENYHGLLRKLRRAHPQIKARVRRVDFGAEKTMLGSCLLIEKNGTFLILIDKNASPELQCWVLMHEWAHAMTWHGPCHGPEWGMAYSECYRLWADEVTEEV